MRLGTQEHIDVMSSFESWYAGRNLSKAPKEDWPKGTIYLDTFVNELFLAFRKGASFGKACWRES